MKKALLFSLLFFVCLSVMAYETIIIKYPAGEMWVKAYYKKKGSEAILQYVPNGQASNNWQRTIVVHSYNESGYPINVFMNNNVAMMQKTNPTAKYKTLRSTANDAIVGRCTQDYKNIEAQCEFFRVTRAHDAVVSVHYINKDKDDFMRNYDEWYNIIKRAKFLNSYYRNERTLNKSEYFEI